LKRLTPKQLKFVEFYLAGNSGAVSARLAGFSEKCAGERAMKLLNRNPLVKEAVAEARKTSEGKAKYNYESAMQEADRAIQFAVTHKNANAYVKAAELKMKLSGLLIERHDVRQVGFSINISGIDAAQGALEASPALANALPPAGEEKDDGSGK
jgi:phage terminase small subunit